MSKVGKFSMNLVLIGVMLVLLTLIGRCDWKERVDAFYRSKEKGVGLAWLKLAPSARGIALGNAYISVVDDPTASWWNPGALGRVKNTHFNFTHTHHFMGIRYEFLGLATKLGANAYGVTISGLFINGIELRNEQQDLLGEFNAYDFLASFSYARTLVEGVHLGGTLKGLRERIYIYESSTWLVDFGVSYMITPELWFGGVLLNLGKYPKFKRKQIKPPIGWKVGTSYKKYGLLLSCDVTKYIDAVMQAGIGVEYVLPSFLSLRGGYIISSPDRSGFSAGFGVKWKEIKLDYAFRPYKFGLGSAHIFTITR